MILSCRLFFLMVKALIKYPTKHEVPNHCSAKEQLSIAAVPT